MLVLKLLPILLVLRYSARSAPAVTSILSQTDEDILSKTIEAFPESDFENDFLLKRKSEDTFVNDKKHGRITFKLKTQHPMGANVIILNGHEDLLRRGEESVSQQQTFVVLRRKSSETDKYYVSYVYLRALFEEESTSGLGIIEFSNGVKKRMEFDIWDRRGESGNYEQHFGWTICSRTFFISCIRNDEEAALTPFGDAETSVDYEDVSQEAEEGGSPTQKSETGEEPLPDKYKAGEATKNKTKVKLRNDYFTDLDDEFDHAWLVGATVILAANVQLKVETAVGEAALDVSQAPTAEGSRKKRALFGFIKSKGTCDENPQVTNETPVSMKAVVKNDILGFADDGRNRTGTDFRGIHGDKMNANEKGMLKPVDTLTKKLNGFLGYSPDKPSTRSPGQRWANAVRNGGGAWNGLFTGSADMAGILMGEGTVSNDRSHLDGILEEGLAGILGGVGGAAFDIVNSVARPLGLGQVLGMVAGTAGLALGGSLGGPAAAVIAPLQLGLQFVKVIAKFLGLGGLIGMKGTSMCIHKLGFINKYAEAKTTYDMQFKQQVEEEEDEEDEEEEEEEGPAGRSFGSKAFKYKASYDTKPHFQASIDLFNPIGWRGLLTRKKEPFVGIGNCLENPELTAAYLDFLKENPDVEAYVKLYLTSLKTSCSKHATERLTSLVMVGSLDLNKTDQTFDMNPDLPQISKLKLTPKDMSDLSQVFEMAIYSKAYATCFRKHSDTEINATDPAGGRISNSVNFLVKFTFEVFAEAVKNIPIHLVKIVRNTILTLKTAFIKILQNVQVLTLCQICIQEEKDETHNDAMTVYTLIQFLMDQFEPKEAAVKGADSAELENAYNEFYKSKIEEFNKRFEWYTQIPHGKNIYTLVPESEPLDADEDPGQGTGAADSAAQGNDPPTSDDAASMADAVTPDGGTESGDTVTTE